MVWRASANATCNYCYWWRRRWRCGNSGSSLKTRALCSASLTPTGIPTGVTAPPPKQPSSTIAQGTAEAANYNGDDEKYQQHLVETMRRVRNTIKRRSNWESSLFSLFSPSHLFHPDCVRLVLSSMKPVPSLRYFLWLSSSSDAVSQPFCLDAATSSRLLERLADARAWKSGLLMIRSTKCRPDPSTLDSFLQHLILAGKSCNVSMDDIVEAISSVLSAPHLSFSPSFNTWNAALSVSLRLGRTDLLWRLYEMMDKSGIVGDATTAGHLIRAFCKENKLADAYNLLREVLKVGVVPNVVSFTALIGAFCRKGDYGKVSELLHMMIAAGCMPDIFTFQSIVHGLCKNGMTEEGFHVFNNLKLRGYAPDLVTYTTMIDGLCKLSRMGEAQKLWLEMVRKGMEPNEYTYNAILDGYCKAGDLEHAQKLYNEMSIRGFKESTVRCNTLITGFSFQGRMDEAMDFFNEMCRKGVERDVITYNVLIQGLCKEGRIHEALKLFDELLSVDLQPSVSTYTPLIKALCDEGNLVEAVKLMQSMEDKGLEPLVCTNDFIISGFCNVANVEEGMTWSLNMFRKNLKPKKETVNRLLEALSVSSRLDDALLVLNVIFEFGYNVETSVFYSLTKQLCQDNYGQTSLEMDKILMNN